VLTEPFALSTWAESVNALISPWTTLVLSTVMVVLITVGVSGAVTFFGIPVIALALGWSRLAGMFERARGRWLLGIDVTGPAPLAPRGNGLLRWLWGTLTDSAGWRALAYLIVQPFVAVLVAVVTFGAWSAALAELTSPLWFHLLPPGSDFRLLFGFQVHSLAGASLGVPVGVVLLLAAPWLIHAVSDLDRALIRGLLGATTLSDRVRQLETSRGQAVDTAAADLRRIERDLHDGAQARLVSLAMNLGMAKERLGETDPDAAQMVSSAHDEAKRALRELRDLARGIHPAILTDRGLDAALSSVAASATVPVQVEVSLPNRPSQPIEAIAYFCVTELLTNISRHSGASHALVRVTERTGRLHISVIDDGHGGADASRGTGLRGLAERVASVEGRFLVHSPAGGPTTIEIDLPLAG
jgi:signal transduction histidine kinase